MIVVILVIILVIILAIILLLPKGKTKSYKLNGPPLLSASESEKYFKIGKIGTITRSQLPDTVKQALDAKGEFILKLPITHIPESYKCPELCAEPLNQGSCGSCWAFSTSGMLTDRTRPVTDQHLRVSLNYRDGNTVRKIRDQLSPFFLAGCDYCDTANHDRAITDFLISRNDCNKRCQGGILQYSLQWIHDNGLMTLTCDESSLGAYYCHKVGNLNQIIPLGASHPCHMFKYGTPQRYNLYDSEDLTGTKLKENMENIQRAIKTLGTVSASFIVYPSFYDFFGIHKGEIYGTQPGEKEVAVGGHAICIVGWGTEDGKLFWICRNSWGVDWNDTGFFKILRGVNLCNIESDVWGCDPDLQWIESIDKKYHLDDPTLQALLESQTS